MPAPEPVGVTNFHPKGMVRADTLLERIQKWHPNWKVQVSIYTYFRFSGPAALNPVRVRVGKYSWFLHCLGRTQGLYTYISRLKSGKNFCNFQTTRITLKPTSWCEFGEGIAGRVCWIRDEHTDVFFKTRKHLHPRAFPPTHLQPERKI